MILSYPGKGPSPLAAHYQAASHWQTGCSGQLQVVATRSKTAPQRMEKRSNLRQFRIVLLLLGLGIWWGSLASTSAVEVAVAWNPPVDASDVTGFRVRYGTSSGQYTAVTNVGLRTSAVFTELNGGLTYYFAASSVDAEGNESVASNEVSVDIPGPPPQPTGAENVSFAQNTTSPAYPFRLLGLNGSTNWVLLGESSDHDLLSPAGINITGTGSNRFVTLTPQPNRTGTGIVTLVATDFVITNKTSFFAEVTPPNLAPVVDAGAGTTVRTNLNYMLRGRASDDGLPRKPGRLTLRWSKISGPGTVTFGNSNLAVSSVRLSAAGLYRLRLTATDGELTSSSDTIIRALLLSDVTPPVISNFNVDEVTSSSIAVSWTTDEPADDQLRYYLGDAIPKFSLLNPTPRTTHQVVLTNLSSDTLYTLVARSRDPSGNQTLSDAVDVRTLAPALVSAPPVLGSLQVDGVDVDTAGTENPSATTSHHVIRVTKTIATGWSLFASPVTAVLPSISELLPHPPEGTFLLKIDPESGETVTNAFNGQEWFDSSMTLEAGEGGLLYNPAAPYSWTIQGRPGESLLPRPLYRDSQTAGSGNRFLGLAGAFGGLLRAALPDFQFRAGDQIRRLRPDTNQYETSTFDGHRWDLIPVMNVGEAVFLDLVPGVGTQSK